MTENRARTLGHVPNAQLIILLDAPAEVLQARKQEVPIAETQRQQVSYRALVGSFADGHVVNAAKPLQEVVAQVNSVILDFMAKRTERRFGLTWDDDCGR
jgi:hypothetical protein